jgi:anti-sigma factor (TIGR02949 family)
MDDRCREALRALQTYVDGECGRSLESVISRHLEDCSPCLDRVDFEREVRAILARRCKDAAPSGLLDRIVDRLRSTRTDLGGEPTPG